MASRSALRADLAAFALVLPLLVLESGPASAVNRVSGSSPDRVTADTDVLTGRALVTLENPADQRAVLRPEPLVRSADGGDPVPAAWSRLRDGHGPDPGGTFTLEAHETATFEVRGTFPRAGVWETAIEMPDANGAPVRLVLAITRTAPPISTELLVEPRPGRIDLPFPRLTTQAAQRVKLAVRNASTGPAVITSVGAGSMTRVVGGTSVSVALPMPPRAYTDDCIVVLEANQGCQITVVLPAGLGPGHYAVDASVRGAGGGQSQQTQLVDVRASAWWAGLLVAIGALLGALLDTWRKSGRSVVGARMAVAQRAAEAADLAQAAQSPAARRAVEVLRQALADLDDRLWRGAEATPNLAPYDARFDAIAAAMAAEAEAARIPPEAAALLSPRSEELAGSLQAAAYGKGAPSDSTGLAAAAAALRTRAEAVAALIATATKARALALSVGPMLRELLQESIGKAWRELDDSLRAAFAPLPASAPESTLPERRAALQGKMDALDQALATDLPAKLTESVIAALKDATGQGEFTPDELALKKRAEKLAEAWSKQPREERLLAAEELARDVVQAIKPGAPQPSAAQEAPTGTAAAASVPSLIGADSGLVLQLDRLLRGPAGRATLQGLAAYRDFWDWVTDLIVLVAIGAVGVLTLWVDAPAWGTVTDLLTALLAGAGTRVALGIVTQRA